MITQPLAVAGRWANRNFSLIDALAADPGNSLVDLWEKSPIRLDSNAPRTDEIIDILFPSNPSLCCGWKRHCFDTRPRNHWYKLDDFQFIVQNPMVTRLGLTK